MDEMDGPEAARRTTVFQNGKFRPGAAGVTVYINPLQTLQMFLKSAGERLGGVDAQRLFNSDGGEVDDLMLVDDGDILFVSAGEDFQAYPGDTGGNPSVGGVNGSQQGAGGAAKAGAANGKGRIDRIGGYRLTAYLGRGAYGKVYKGVHQLTEQPVAIKFISKMSMGNVADAERIATEIHCLETLQHRSVIKLHQVLNTDRAVALVFEYAGGGDLRQKVKACRRIPEPEAARLFANIMDGVIYCHRRHIVHHDLKLENILLDDEGNAKIADFGLSRVYRPGSTSTSTAGSLAYIAPEVLKDGATAGPPRDVWSLGVILYAMVCGRLPFEHSNRNKLIRRITTGSFGFDSPSVASKACRDLIGALLTVDPEARATLPSLRMHPWIVRHRRDASHMQMFSSPLLLMEDSDDSGYLEDGNDNDRDSEADSDDKPGANADGAGAAAATSATTEAQDGSDDSAGRHSPSRQRRVGRARAQSYGTLGAGRGSKAAASSAVRDGSGADGSAFCGERRLARGSVATAAAGTAKSGTSNVVGWSGDDSTGSAAPDGADANKSAIPPSSGRGRHRASHLMHSSVRMRKGGVWGDGWASGGANRVTHPSPSTGDAGRGGRDGRDAGDDAASGGEDGSGGGGGGGGTGGNSAATSRTSWSRRRESGSTQSSPLTSAAANNGAEDGGGSKHSDDSGTDYEGVENGSSTTSRSAKAYPRDATTGRMADSGSASRRHQRPPQHSGRTPSDAGDQGSAGGESDAAAGGDEVLSGSLDPGSATPHRGSFRRRRLKRRVVLTSLQGSDRGLRATPGTPGSHHSGSTYASTPMSSRGGVGASRDALPADTPTSTTTLQRMQSGRARPHTAAALFGSPSSRSLSSRLAPAGSDDTTPRSPQLSAGKSARRHLRYRGPDATRAMSPVALGSLGPPGGERRDSAGRVDVAATPTRARRAPPGHIATSAAAAAGAAPFTLAASPHSPATQPYGSSRSFFGRDRAGSLSSVLTDDAPPGEAAVQLLPGDSAVRSARRRSNTRIAPLPRQPLLRRGTRFAWRVAIATVRAAVRWVRLGRERPGRVAGGASTAAALPQFRAVRKPRLLFSHPRATLGSPLTAALHDEGGSSTRNGPSGVGGGKWAHAAVASPVAPGTSLKRSHTHHGGGGGAPMARLERNASGSSEDSTAVGPASARAGFRRGSAGAGVSSPLRLESRAMTDGMQAGSGVAAASLRRTASSPLVGPSLLAMPDGGSGLVGGIPTTTTTTAATATASGDHALSLNPLSHPPRRGSLQQLEPLRPGTPGTTASRPPSTTPGSDAGDSVHGDGGGREPLEHWRRARTKITAVVRFGHGNVYAAPQHLRAVRGNGGTPGDTATGADGSDVAPDDRHGDGLDAGSPSSTVGAARQRAGSTHGRPDAVAVRRHTVPLRGSTATHTAHPERALAGLHLAVTPSSGRRDSDSDSDSDAGDEAVAAHGADVVADATAADTGGSASPAATASRRGPARSRRRSKTRRAASSGRRRRRRHSNSLVASGTAPAGTSHAPSGSHGRPRRKSSSRSKPGKRRKAGHRSQSHQKRKPQPQPRAGPSAVAVAAARDLVVSSFHTTRPQTSAAMLMRKHSGGASSVSMSDSAQSPVSSPLGGGSVRSRGSGRSPASISKASVPKPQPQPDDHQLPQSPAAQPSSTAKPSTRAGLGERSRLHGAPSSTALARSPLQSPVATPSPPPTLPATSAAQLQQEL